MFQELSRAEWGRGAHSYAVGPHGALCEIIKKHKFFSESLNYRKAQGAGNELNDDEEEQFYSH